MAKKKETKGEVKQFPIKEVEEVVDPRETMTPEEIAAYMKKEEEEMERRLSKFMIEHPKPDTSEIIEEDDEEDEDFVIDLSKGIVTQKVGEGYLPAEEVLKIMEESDMDVFVPVKEPVLKENPYTSFITKLFVRKAIAALVRQTRDERDALDAQLEKMPGYLRDDIWSMTDKIEEKKTQLMRVIRNNEVHYEDIPEWATRYIEEYVERTLTSLILFVEE